MSLTYRTGEYIIHPKLHLIEIGQQKTQVRSKVFSLLMCFIEHPDETLSKEYLLETIWDDVQVDQQVLFQSIREIRLLFKEHIVIKTHPRKGYSWIANIEKQSNTIQTQQATEFKPISAKKFKLKAIAVASLLLFALMMTYWQTSSKTAFKGSVVVLPVKSSIDDIDHKWIYLGAMEQVISQLVANQSVAVMHTDYVLEIMRRAELPRNYNSEQVERVFDVSGASIVVESELSGSVQDYRLAYKFYFDDHVKRGVIFNNTTAGALTELAQKIAFYTGQSLKIIDQQSNTDFNSELLARGLELTEQKNFAGASRLLTSLLELEPANMVATRLLVEALIRQDKLDLAEQTIKQALQKFEANGSPELARLHFNLGMIQSFRGNFELAEASFKQTDRLAQLNNDWLFRAYSAQQLASIQGRLNHYPEAQKLLEQALNYHQVIQCPVGQSLTWLQMSKLSVQQGNVANAEQYFSLAEQLIQQRQLTELNKNLESNRRKLL